MMSPTPSLSATILRDLTSLRNLSPEWTALWEKCEGLTPFQRPEWLVPWTEAFKPHPLHVVQVRHGRELVALAPMFAYESSGQTILASIGAGITDYLDWLILPGYAPQAIDAILNTLADSDCNWDRIDLPDLPPASTLIDDSRRFNFKQAAHEVCPVVELLSCAAERKAVIPDRQRKNLRTARNRTTRAGEARIEVADATQLPEFLHAMFRLHTARWQGFGMPGVLSEVTIQDFHQRSAPGLLRAGLLRFYGLRFCGDLIAVLHTLWGRNTVYCYLQGFDPAYSFFSPGLQIIAAVIEDAIRAGKLAVDFLRGREAYKYSWGARDRSTTRLQLSRRELVQHSSPRVAA